VEVKWDRHPNSLCSGEAERCKKWKKEYMMWNAQAVAIKVVLTPLSGMETPISVKNVGGSSQSWEHRCEEK